MWSHVMYVWLQTVCDKFTPSRLRKIDTRLAQIPAEIAAHEMAIQELNLRSDDLVAARSSMERRDEFTQSTIDLINGEVLHREHLVVNLRQYEADLKARKEKLSPTPHTAVQRVSVYS